MSNNERKRCIDCKHCNGDNTPCDRGQGVFDCHRIRICEYFEPRGPSWFQRMEQRVTELEIKLAALTGMANDET